MFLKDSPWRVLETRTLVDRRPWYRISEQDVELPDGRIVQGFPQMELRDYAIVVALTPTGEVLIEWMYKHGPGHHVFDLVAGVLEDGEDPLQAAQRELREETGYASEQWSSLGTFTVNSNYGCGRMHAFLARDARIVSEPNSTDLEEMELVLRPFDEAIADLRRGRFELLSAAAALALAHAQIGPSLRR